MSIRTQTLGSVTVTTGDGGRSCVSCVILPTCSAQQSSWLYNELAALEAMDAQLRDALEAVEQAIRERDGG